MYFFFVEITCFALSDLFWNVSIYGFAWNYNFNLVSDIWYIKYVFDMHFWLFCIILYNFVLCVSIMCRIISQMWMNAKKELMDAVIFVATLMVVLYVNVVIRELDSPTISKTAYVSA